MLTPIYRTSLPPEMDGGKLETVLAGAGYPCSLYVVNGAALDGSPEIDLRPPQRWTDDEWAAVRKLVAEFVPVPDAPTRLEELRAKRRNGEKFTAEEVAEAVDKLLGV